MPSRKLMPSAMPRCWARSSNRSQTPCFAQRSNRCAAGHHEPIRRECWCHFAPFWCRQKIAVMVRCNSFGVLPRHRLDQRLPNRPRQLWAASLWEVKARRRRLFMQDRVAASAGLFFDSLLFLMACRGRSGARGGGWGRKRPVLPAPGDSRRSWDGAAGMPMCCAISCAGMSSRTGRTRTRCRSLTRPASWSRARRPAVLRGSTPARGL